MVPRKFTGPLTIKAVTALDSDQLAEFRTLLRGYATLGPWTLIYLFWLMGRWLRKTGGCRMLAARLADKGNEPSGDVRPRLHSPIDHRALFAGYHAAADLCR